MTVVIADAEEVRPRRRRPSKPRQREPSAEKIASVVSTALSPSLLLFYLRSRSHLYCLCGSLPATHRRRIVETCFRLYLSLLCYYLSASFNVELTAVVENFFGGDGFSHISETTSSSSPLRGILTAEDDDMVRLTVRVRAGTKLKYKVPLLVPFKHFSIRMNGYRPLRSNRSRPSPLL